MRSAPERIRIRVDLPAPFSPNRAWISPPSTRKSTPFSAWTPGKRRETPSISTTGLVLGPVALALIAAQLCAGLQARKGQEKKRRQSRAWTERLSSEANDLSSATRSPGCLHGARAYIVTSSNGPRLAGRPSRMPRKNKPTDASVGCVTVRVGWAERFRGRGSTTADWLGVWLG